MRPRDLPAEPRIRPMPSRHRIDPLSEDDVGGIPFKVTGMDHAPPTSGLTSSH